MSKEIGDLDDFPSRLPAYYADERRPWLRVVAEAAPHEMRIDPATRILVETEGTAQ